LRLHCSTFSGATRNCLPEIANLSAFFVTRSQLNAFLTRYILMADKSVEAVERLAFEHESEHVENEPRIMSTTPRPKPAS